MPEKSNQEAIWKELARALGQYNGNVFTIEVINTVHSLSLRWVKSAQDAAVTNELNRVIENLDRARQEVIKHSLFAVASLGVGFVAELALLSRAGQAGRLFQLRPQMWRAPLSTYAPLVSGGSGAVQTGRLSLQFSESGIAAVQATQTAFRAAHPLLVAPELLLQRLAASAAQVLLFTAAKVDMSGKPAKAIQDGQRNRKFRQAMSEYDRALENALRHGLQNGAPQNKQHYRVILGAAAAGKLNDLRNKISDDIDKLLDRKGHTGTEKSAMKLSLLIDLWYGVYQWAERQGARLRSENGMLKQRVTTLEQQAKQR